MDMIYDELNRVLDSAGVPRIVRERCFQCGGAGIVPRWHEGEQLAMIERCSACGGCKTITREVA